MTYIAEVQQYVLERNSEVSWVFNIGPSYYRNHLFQESTHSEISTYIVIIKITDEISIC